MTQTLRRRTGIFFTSLALAALLGACAAPVQMGGAPHAVASLRFIGEQRLALKQQYGGTTIGGLSGIDYDPGSGDWIMESDDRSAYSPARFYTARLDYDSHAFHGVQLTGVDFFRQADGSTYPGVKDFTGRNGEVPDIESIRLDPLDGSVWYASEGDRKLGLDPFVKHAGREGRYLATFPLPALFKVHPRHEAGARDNMSFEGLSFAPDGRTLWLGMETAIYEDGPISTPDNGSVSRFTHFDRSGKVLGQYAYQVEAIPARPGPGKFADNGVSEILAVDDHRLLVIERSGVQAADKSFKNYIRLYEADVDGATDVAALASLQGASYTPAKKRLVLDLNTLDLPKLDNLEGIAWGPKLENGHDSLVIVSDDNFNSTQVTQLLLFEVLPK